ncbi:unnamed protein product [Caenorhabditis auriculariae]|uniref:Uncharacterized protein n=1 Tax=Caenorhabditis auriculariae TaxID=2777116 RepID=A0A8S1GRV7_9PELO|nr:unnamed protein product [Caenorhabditis auriculariae]
MTNSKDVPLEAPTLLNVAARAVDTKMLLHDTLQQFHLPIPVSHALFARHRAEWNTYKKEDHDVKETRKVLRAWCDSERLPLTNIDLSGAVLDDRILVDLFTAHQSTVDSIDLTNVKGATDEANTLLDLRNVQFPRLKSLKMTSMELLSRPQPRRKHGMAAVDVRDVLMLGEKDLEGAQGLDNMRESRGGPSRDSLQISSEDTAQECLQSCSTSSKDWHLEEEDEERETPVFTSRCPNVTSLCLPRFKKFPEEEESSVNALLSRVFDPLKRLEHLDLSLWTRLDDLRCIHPLHETLTSLILYDVPDLYHAINTITQMTELRVLDLSQATRETGIYPRPVSTLHQIVTSLKQLTHLDISSTNLPSQPTANDFPFKLDNKNGGVRSDIAGLQALDQPLVFLGLFNCENGPHVLEIPAKYVSGDANEDQVITALQMYKDRAGLLQSVLNESYQLYRFGNNKPLQVRHTEALHLVLDAMQRHLHDGTLQIAGSASLFYIIRKVDMNRDTKKQVVSALLSGMEVHMEEQVMVRNCCLSLCQFEIPQDILFDYSRLAVLLVTVLQHHNADNLTQRIVVFLLNSMACHVEGDQKIEVGSYGAIEMIIEQIRRKHTQNVCDDVMEVGWSFLWNITDETPVNCEKFLAANGLTLFRECFSAFRQERELVRNMMGLIGNIAEVDELRSQLMNAQCVEIFCTLLDQVEDSIEISYNSAGVLAHMVSDGPEAWNLVKIDREEVMKKIVKATDEWKLQTRRFINYRSFRPILRLLPLYNAYASQHWAVWALANLTTTDGSKYCAYVIDEGGMPLLEELVLNEQTTDPIRELASAVLENIRLWRDKKQTRESEAAEEDVEMAEI